VRRAGGLFGGVPTAWTTVPIVMVLDQQADTRMIHTIQNRKAIRLLAGVSGLAALAACASTPPAPLASLQAAQQAITTAEGVDAGHSAPGELGEARSKLVAANVAVKDGHMISADRLAQQSRAAADLAAAKTASVKAMAVNAEVKAGNAALAEELNRNDGVSR
jgi:hypothetical protein